MHQCTFKGRKGKVLHMQSRIYSFRSFFPEKLLLRLWTSLSTANKIRFFNFKG